MANELAPSEIERLRRIVEQRGFLDIRDPAKAAACARIFGGRIEVLTFACGAAAKNIVVINEDHFAKWMRSSIDDE